jgi:hypothetical protein
MLLSAFLASDFFKITFNIKGIVLSKNLSSFFHTIEVNCQPLMGVKIPLYVGVPFAIDRGTFKKSKIAQFLHFWVEFVPHNIDYVLISNDIVSNMKICIEKNRQKTCFLFVF